MKNSLKHDFLRFVKRHHLLSPRQKILIGVSGGRDSMVLLHLLQQWQPYFQSELGVVHVNHSLRGEASDADAEFVRKYCEKQGLAVFIRKVDVRKFARRKKLSLEEMGHLLREEIFKEIREKEGYQVTVTAHHLEDQVETIFMRLMKGAGLEGLAGIRLKRPGVIRPLLFASRKQIEAYAEHYHIPYREDVTNRDLRILRNRIRHQLLPYLKENFGIPNFANLLYTSLILQEWMEYLESKVEMAEKQTVKQENLNEITLELKPYKTYFSLIQKKILENILLRSGGQTKPISYNKFQDFLSWLECTNTGRSFHSFPGVIAYPVADKIVFQKQRPARKEIHLEVFPDQLYPFPELHRQLKLRVQRRAEISFDLAPDIEFVEAGKIRFPLIVRTWRAGDRFKPLGMKEAKLVSDFLTDRKIREPEKKEILLLENRGEIVCVLGLRISEDYKITYQTKSVVKIEYREL